MENLIPVLVLGILGLTMGVFLAYAAKKFEVERDPLVEKINEALPGANCGACGYPGCMGYAEAVALKGAEINLCAPGGNDVVGVLAELTGKNAAAKEKVIARIMCQGDNTAVKKIYEFDGEIKTCANANLYFGGDKACMYACIGYGDCARVCPAGAITTNEKGLAEIDEEKCISCGKCVDACPKHVIRMVPQKSKVTVKCSNREKAAAARQNCSVACIACGLCAKNCPVDAIEIKGNLAKIDTDKCVNCGICALKCPTNAIESQIKDFKVAEIVEEKCIGCTACARVCPVGAIEGKVKEKHKVLADKCIGCGLCEEKCKFDAIVMKEKVVKQ